MKATNLLVASTGEIFSQFILGLASIAIKPLSENTLKLGNHSVYRLAHQLLGVFLRIAGLLSQFSDVFLIVHIYLNM